MVCMIHCGIAMVFLIGMIYFAFAVDKMTVAQGLYGQLDAQQQQKYTEIIQKRRSIYLTGFGVGTALAFLTILYNKRGSKMGWTDLCLVGSIIFLTSYFYYILTPKPELMVVYLTTESQRKAWADIYRKMSFNYHLGMFLGILAIVIFMRGWFQ